MARRSSSPRMVGRDAELAELVGAVRHADDERRVILVEGEAGIGKTRLLNELVAAVRDDPATDAVQVVRGSCMSLAEGELPFAPILEIVDELGRQAELSADAESILVELSGGPESGSVGAGSRARAFRQVRDLLAGAAADSELVVVVDDLHWADRSTLDLLTFLARRLRGTSVLLVGAYRSDELHRRHPLRPVLAELSRGFVRHHVALAPLSPQAIGDQVEAIIGRSDPALGRRVARRADGNPFHAEELLAVEAPSGPLPDSFRDVLLSRIESLDRATSELVRICAVVGRNVDEPMLDAIGRIPPDAVRDGLREAVDRSILTPADDGRGYRFRHALLQEAVYDDLLPADRVELHRLVADLLANRPDLQAASPAVAAAELARHRDQSGQPDLAFDAYLEAGFAAYRATAWAEAAAAFDRASTISAARSDTPVDGRLLPALAPAGWALYLSGELRRAVAFLQGWIDRLEAAGDGATAAELLLDLAQIQNSVGDEPAAIVATDRALRIPIPEDRPHTRAAIAVARAGQAYLDDRYREVLELSGPAERLAAETDDLELRLHTLADRAAALVYLGRLDEAARVDARSMELDPERRAIKSLASRYANRPWALMGAGELVQAGAILQDALRVSAELGVSDDWDPWTIPGLAFIAALQGRWDDGLALCARFHGYRIRGFPEQIAATAQAWIDAGRGDVESAVAVLETAQTALGGAPRETQYLDLADAEVRAATGDLVAAIASIDHALAAYASRDDCFYRSWLAAAGSSIAADLAAVGPSDARASAAADAERFASLASAIDEGRDMPGFVPSRMTRANALRAAAEQARAMGRDGPEAWAAAISAFEELGMWPRVATLRYREAESWLRAGDEAQAAEALRRAQELALDIGMTVLDGRIASLARAARLEIVEPTSAGVSGPREATLSDPWGLSEREREVLGLVAAGRTNGEIGEALFISPKTASVHVTHILDKLGVSSRTEAALLGLQSGVLK